MCINKTRAEGKITWLNFRNHFGISLDVRYGTVQCRHQFFLSFILPTNNSAWFQAICVKICDQGWGHENSKNMWSMNSSSLSLVCDTHTYRANVINTSLLNLESYNKHINSEL